jgi:1-acyl-sn-glycerol-3-phosphate acyltransferase
LTAQTPGTTVDLVGERLVATQVSPWLGGLATVLTHDLVLPHWFRSITVEGQEMLPRSGPLVLAPTHRARWDALLLPYVAGRRVTGRDCRFMVTVDEMQGLQGWVLSRLGCFAVDQARPSLSSLRHAVELLAGGQQLVLFPEGRIRRHDEKPARLQQGLGRLVGLATSRGVSVPVIPVGIAYSHAIPRLCDRVAVCFGRPMHLMGGGRQAAGAFTADLAVALAEQESHAQASLGQSPVALAGRRAEQSL